MENKGYTLAEVLISLGIIGVVSALTISMLNFTSASKLTATKLINAAGTLNNVSTAMLAKKGYTSVTDGWRGSNGFNYEAYINDLSDQIKSTHTTALLLQPVYAEEEEIQGGGGGGSICHWENAGDCINNNQLQIWVCDGVTRRSRTVACSSFDTDDFDYITEPNIQQQSPVNRINNLSAVDFPNESQIIEAQSHTTSNGTNYLFLFDENFDENATSVPPSKQRIGYVWIDLDGDNDNSANIIGYDRFLFSWFNDGTIRPVGSKNWDGSMNSNTWDQRIGSTTRCGADSNPKSNQENAKYCAGSIFENNKVIYKL